MDLSQGRAHNSERDDTDILVDFKEWLRAQDGQNGRLSLHAVADASWDNEASGTEFDFSPDNAPVATGSDGRSLARRSIGRRRMINRGFVIVLTAAVLAGATVAWQHYADAQTKGMARAELARAWRITASLLSSVFPAETRSRTSAATRPPSDLTALPVTETSSIAATQNTTAPQAASVTAPAPVVQTADEAAVGEPIVAPAASVAAPVPAVVTAVIPPELQQAFNTLGSDLADVRHMVEQIAATQQQIAADQEQIAARQQQVLQQMATLQAAEVALTEKLSAPPKATTAAVAPRNSKNKPPLPQAGVRSPSGASSAPRNGMPLQLR
jgi:hypothetical protein